MRKLAVFSGAFALGVFLAQVLPGTAWQPLAAAGCLAAAVLALALPGLWRKRGLLALCALSLAFGWNWLYADRSSGPWRPGRDGTDGDPHDPLRLRRPH